MYTHCSLEKKKSRILKSKKNLKSNLCSRLQKLSRLVDSTGLLSDSLSYGFFFFPLHAVPCTHQGRQREPSVKTLSSSFSANFWRHCVSSGALCALCATTGLSSYYKLFFACSFACRSKMKIAICCVQQIRNAQDNSDQKYSGLLRNDSRHVI